MKFKINNKYFRWGLTAFLAIAAAIVFYYFVFHSSNIKSGIKTITNILMPVVVGMVIAYLLTPVLNFVEQKILFPLCKKLKLKDGKKKKSVVRCISILITVFLFVGLIYFLLHMLISQIVPSVQNIVTNFDSYTTSITKWLNQALEDNPEAGEYVIKTVTKYSAELEDWFTDILPNTAAGLIKTVSMSAIGVFGVVWDFIIGFIISIYMMASKEKFAGQAKKIIYAVFEQDTSNILIKNLRFTHQTFIGFLGGKIVDSIIIGILCFIGTSFLKLPYAALVSVIIGVTNIIPFFGPFLGAVPCTLLIFVVNPLRPLNCLYFVLFILILQQVDGNIIGPKILGNSTGLTGFWVIFAITLFGGLFGVFGMIIGVPILAVIYAAVRAAVNIALDKKQLPTESRKYEKLDYVDESGFHEINTEDDTGKNNRTVKSGGSRQFQAKRHYVWHSKMDDKTKNVTEKKDNDHEISDSEGK
ncbi:MAG: AI-2E family transporter [Acetatifactor sp.]|nr:AI-2E family transporter [Acetatifactor sp.]